MEHEPDERRAMIRVARIATDRAATDHAGPPPSENRPPSGAAAGHPAAVWQQTLQATAGWTYLASFLLISPFLWSPPFWIATLAQLPERDRR
jgi:hypothetical protein